MFIFANGILRIQCISILHVMYAHFFPTKINVTLLHAYAIHFLTTFLLYLHFYLSYNILWLVRTQSKRAFQTFCIHTTYSTILFSFSYHFSSSFLSYFYRCYWGLNVPFMVITRTKLPPSATLHLFQDTDKKITHKNEHAIRGVGSDGTNEMG